MSRSDFVFFLSGIFFGGAIDHVILALMRSDRTPYGVRFGVKGNWGLAGLDLVLALIGYRLARRSRAHLRNFRSAT